MTEFDFNYSTSIVLERRKKSWILNFLQRKNITIYFISQAFSPIILKFDTQSWMIIFSLYDYSKMVELKLIEIFSKYLYEAWKKFSNVTKNYPCPMLIFYSQTKINKNFFSYKTSQKRNTTTWNYHLANHVLKSEVRGNRKKSV